MNTLIYTAEGFLTDGCVKDVGMRRLFWILRVGNENPISDFLLRQGLALSAGITGMNHCGLHNGPIVRGKQVEQRKEKEMWCQEQGLG